MTITGYYKTLNGDIGKCTGAAVLNSYLEDIFEIEKRLILAQIEFDNGTNEWWLNTQLIEVEEPNVALF